MEVKVNKIDEVKQEVEFEIPYGDLTPHFEKAYKKYQKKAEIPGFRKGKAPISILKRKYGELIEQSSLEEVANDVFREYLETNHVHPLGEGSLVDMDYQSQSLLTFKVRFEVKPDINLAEYKGIEITRTLHKLDDSLVDEEIKYLQSKNVTYENADKAENSEYVVTMDVYKLDETGVELIGQSDKGVRFYLNDPQINKEFKEQLENVAIGEERILMLPSPEDKDKTEKYKVNCTKVDKVIFPELNEEFFNKIYHDETIKTLVDFKARVKTELEAVYKNITEQELRNNVVNELIKLNDVPVPDTLVNNILDSYIEEVKTQNPKRQLPKDFNEEEYRKTRRVDAILQVKWYLIRDKIIEAEKIEVSDADLQPVIEADAKKYNLPVEKIKEVYEKNPDVKYRILDDKLMKFLIDNAKIKDVEKKDAAINDDETISAEESVEKDAGTKPAKKKKAKKSE